MPIVSNTAVVSSHMHVDVQGPLFDEPYATTDREIGVPRTTAWALRVTLTLTAGRFDTNDK